MGTTGKRHGVGTGDARDGLDVWRHGVVYHTGPGDAIEREREKECRGTATKSLKKISGWHHYCRLAG